METGKTIRGSANLVFDATEGMTHIVEGMYRNIAATPWPVGTAPEGRAPGIAGFVHESIRAVTRATRTATDLVLGSLSPVLDGTLPPGPHRETVISALNGVCGDHLAQSGNSLAISMRFRALLPPNEQPGATLQLEGPEPIATGEKPARFSSLFDTQRRPVDVYPTPAAFAETGFAPGGRLLVLLHGLSMNDRSWTAQQHNHAEALARDCGYTPVYLLYNSGRHISDNGRELSNKLDGLLDAWPVPVESISFMGFSMGGLVTRSALHTGQQEGRAWLQKVDKAVYIGSPHHGAIMERGGYRLQQGFTFSPYTAPLAALGRIRSAGITDLRHGNVQDDDWLHHDEHEDHRDYRRPTPLADGIEHYAIAGTLSKRSGEQIGRLLGDGLVHPSSATGRHSNPELDLAFPEDNTKIFYDLWHLGMLHDTRVMDQLTQWLG